MAIKKIGELLVESGLITAEQLADALEDGRSQKGVRLGAIIVKKGYATELDIAQTLSFQLNIPFVDIASAVPEPESFTLLNEKLAQKYLIFPLSHDKRVIRLAMTDPLNLDAIDDVKFSTGLQAQPCVATPTDVGAAISRYYHLNEPIEDLMTDLKQDKFVEVVVEVDSSRDIAGELKKSAAPPIIKMVDSIIIHGVENRASDIHIEPQERNVKLRLRVDGIMRETMQLPKWVQGPMVSRIKIMSKMDISERRISQDGRFKVRFSDKSLDIRVSTLPTQYGETVVMRILDPKAAKLDVKNIGLLPEDLERLLDTIERPQGVVIVTGPTGCGKTSTLYSMLMHIKSEKINIITIEDPIEYELKDVNQVAVNEKAGLTFSYTLRSVLRQDPDVILVGEMRDPETAIIAHQASLTGHLVFSTLHTNDAVSSILRLKNMGVPPYMVASALNGIVALRLVRKICPDCKETYRPTAAELKKAGVNWSTSKKLFRGAGCQRCGDAGYSGRVGIFEVLPVNNKIKALIAADVPEQELLAAVIDAGMTPLHIDGLKKVSSGITTLEELTRVIYLSKGEEEEQMEVLEELCQQCAKPRQPGWSVCPYCATKFIDEKDRIPQLPSV
ncbi:type II secretion system protein GspE [bacterium]|nr:MAG: type II secretion system protein GspE [bacterium]